MPNTQERSVGDIVDLASAYYGSAILFAGIELDIFSAIEQHPDGATLETLSHATGLNPRALRLLLDGCVATGLLRKTGNVYDNTPAGKAALVQQAPHDLRGAIKYNKDVYPAWGKLADFVRSGAPVDPPEVHLGEDQQRTRRFALAMHGRAMGIGRAVVPMLPLQDCRRLLDLAGGPGAYATLMAQANPELECVTMDLPAISAVASELVERAGLAGRICCKPGNYHTDTYEPEAFDAVTIFGALHQEAPEMIVSILKRAAAALKPGGKIMILDMMSDATHTQPAFSALFAVNMALTTYNGWVFSDTELHAWLQEAGFTACTTQPVPPPMPHWLVTAMKMR
jgi:ubiquinone/menaquinone biosynthesis C-methylase UbiE